MTMAQGSAFATEPQLPFPYSASGWLTGGNGKERSSTKKFGSTDATWNSDFWVQSVEHYLTSEEEYRKALLQEVGTLRGAAAVVQAVRLLRRGDTAMAGVLKNEVLAGPGEGLNMFSKFHTMHPAEDCLVGNWVGAGRWALLDLTAGGGDWGPAMGGDGVVHRHTVPSVMDHFSRLHNLKQNVREVRKSEEDKALLQQVGAQAAAQGGETGRLAFQVFNREMQARRLAASAPGSAPLSDAVGTLKDPEEAVRWQRKYQETLLRSELDVYEQTARRHCNPELRADLLPAVCQELKQRTEKARSQLAKLATAQGIPGDIWRDHKWDIFGHEADEHWEEDMEVSEEALRSHDLFLAELAALLSRALRHVVAPPTATWTHAAGYLHDTATPFATNVRFEIFVIRDTAREMQLHVDPGSSSFDIHSYQDMVSSLKLGNQHFSFKQHFLTLSSDPLLATAFSSALRVSHQHIPADEDALQETERLYLDSRALAHVLRQRFEVSSPGGEQELPPLDSEGQPAGGAWRRRIAARSKQRRTRVKGGAAGHAEHHVPVFVFEVHRDVAVLIDEHYNAKALEDMVLVVQNAARDDEHPTGMMCGGALLARPLSPLKEALSATLTHLGGVLPPHLGYNPAKDRVTHDWLWSVGAHVQSFTSVGTRFTELQRDALARSYLLDGLDSAVDAVNAGVLLLRGTHTTPLVHSHLLKNKAAMLELLGCWQFLVDHWRLVMAAAWSLDWDKATDMLAGIEDHALRFRQLAEELSTIPHGGDCMGVVKPSLSVMLVLPTLVASAAVAGAALLYVVLPLACGSSQASSKQRFRLN
ncbi:hypothetical protein QJQ45_014031 [Haematococcus lacustris]|nr:hypothetical protein QJQ45_014031 [Haematococcus lacustris]